MQLLVDFIGLCTNTPAVTISGAFEMKTRNHSDGANDGRRKFYAAYHFWRETVRIESRKASRARRPLPLDKIKDALMNEFGPRVYSAVTSASGYMDTRKFINVDPIVGAAKRKLMGRKRERERLQRRKDKDS